MSGKASLLIEERPALDLPQAESLERLNKQLPPSYDLLRVESTRLAAEKDKFFASDRATDPDLTVETVDEQQLAAAEAAWKTYKQELLASEMDPDIKQAYRWAVNEALASLRMVKASQNNDMMRFRGYNHFVYGEPDPRIFAATADWFRNQAQSALDNDSPEVQSAARQVLDLLEDQGGDRADLMPGPEVFEAVKNSHFKEGGYFALLLAGVDKPAGPKVSKEEGDPILQKIIHNLDSDYKLADASGASWSLDHNEGAVKRPAKYDMPVNRFMGLGVGHEIGGHLLERQNGLRQPLRLMAYGLDRYEKGNEGRAVIREQIPYDSFEKFAGTLRWQDIMRRHLAISLAEGLGADTARPFHQVFAIVNAVDQLWEIKKKGANAKEAAAKADDRTWSLLTDRVYKGTDGQGGAYLKDSTYLEGNLACWRVAAENPELIERGDLGKFDIANPRHIAILQSLGIIPTIS